MATTRYKNPDTGLWDEINAPKLETPRKINGVEFDGSKDITIPTPPTAHTHTKDQVGLPNVDNTADSNKNVLSATKLTAKRIIALTGAVQGQVEFDGSANVNIVTTGGATAPPNMIQGILSSAPSGTSTTITVSPEFAIYDVAMGTSGLTISLALDSATQALSAGKMLTIEVHINKPLALLNITFSGNIIWVTPQDFSTVGTYVVALRTQNSGSSWKANIAYKY